LHVQTRVVRAAEISSHAALDRAAAPAGNEYMRPHAKAAASPMYRVQPSQIHVARKRNTQARDV